MSQTELQAFVQKAITLDVQERIELINFLVKSLPLTEIKSDNIDDIKIKQINDLMNNYYKEKDDSVKVSIDINPNNMM